MHNRFVYDLCVGDWDSRYRYNNLVGGGGNNNQRKYQEYSTKQIYLNYSSDSMGFPLDRGIQKKNHRTSKLDNSYYLNKSSNTFS